MNKSRGTGGKNDRELAYGKSIFGAAQGLISRNSIYASIIDKNFPHVRVGKRILIPADALDRLLERTDGDHEDQQNSEE